MAGTLAWPPAIWLSMTLKELVQHYDAYLLDRWDHTATLHSSIYNLMAVVIRANSKAKPAFLTTRDCHPYRERKKRGIRVEAKDVKTKLKQMAMTLAARH